MKPGEKYMKPCRLLICFWAGVTLLAGYGTGFSTSGALPQLRDISQQAGIRFIHSFGDEKLSNIVESAGAGCALIDYDRDGDLDIYLVNGSYEKSVNHPQGRQFSGKLKNALYRNDGHNRFTDVTGSAGVGDTGYGMAVVAGDYDNDGDPDLYVTNFGPNVFFRNNGDGTFTDVTRKSGVGCDLWSLGATFLDMDNDGWLDLYVGNYLAYDPEYRYFYAGDGFPGPLAYSGQPDILFRNNGDGTFTDITRKSGVYNPDGRAMGVSSCDFNEDGYTDIFVANDAMENYMYKNNGNGTFTNIALFAGTGFGQNGEATSAMSPEFGDFDRNGKMDILIPDMGYSCLFLHSGTEFYTEVSSLTGLAAICGQYTSWSGNFFDFDNDGFLDILITNGDSHFFEPEEDLVLLNTGQKTLKNVSRLLGKDFSQKGMGRGSAVGDIDNDGDLDILILNIGGSPALYENVGGNSGNWLMLDIYPGQKHRQIVGTKATARIKGDLHVRHIMTSTGYLSQSDSRLHFGLGSAGMIDVITLTWPDGQQTTLEQVPANQMVTVTAP